MFAICACGNLLSGTIYIHLLFSILAHKWLTKTLTMATNFLFPFSHFLELQIIGRHNLYYGSWDLVMDTKRYYLEHQKIARTIDMQLKTILKKLIKQRGISVAHLSRSTKVPLQTLHGWINGSEPKSLRQVKTVADYLQVDLDYLCFGIESEKKTNFEYDDFKDEINAGVFEVVLRRIKK